LTDEHFLKNSVRYSDEHEKDRGIMKRKFKQRRSTIPPILTYFLWYVKLLLSQSVKNM